MSTSPNLRLPYLDANQNQKTVTHNAALRMLDALVNLHVASAALPAPPAAPGDWQCWIVASGGTGAWLGKDLNVAAWQDGAWSFYAPNPGFVAYVDALGGALMWNGTAWASLLGAVTSLALSTLGVGTAADPANPVSARLNAALFTALPTTATPAGTGDVRVKLSKQAAGNTASLLFQDSYSGRAEIGLVGDDRLHFRVSPDGTAFVDALVVAAGGSVSFASSPAAPTPAAADNSTKLATTAYADRAVSATLARTQVSDAAYAVLATDRTVAVTALTAPRVLTLPAASAYPGGATLTVMDESGGCSAVNTLTVARASAADTVNGGASAVLASAFGYLALQSNGSNKWTLVDSPGGAVAALNGGALAGFRNRLVNGNFAVNQRGYGGTALAAGAYGHDRWKAGSGGCTYGVTAGTPDTQVNVTAGTLQQVVETVHVEGGAYTLSWAGTATARVIYTATGGSSTTTTAYAASPIVLPSVNAGLAVTVEFGTGTLGRVQLEPGPTATPFERRPLGTELSLCWRYFWASNPLSPTGASEGTLSAFCESGNPSYILGSTRFPVTMRAVPTLSLYNNGVLNQVRRLTTGAVVAMSNPPTTLALTPAGLVAIGTSASLVAGAFYDFDLQASAEL